MAERPSYSVAPGDSQRERILPAGGVLALVGIAVVGMVLVFPESDLLSLLRKEPVLVNQELTIAYLRNVIQTEPKDLNFRWLLVEKLIASSDMEGARQALSETLPMARGNPAALSTWAQWDLAWWKTTYQWATKNGDAPAVALEVRELLQRLQAEASSVTQPDRVFALIDALGTLVPAPPEVPALRRELLEKLLDLPTASGGDLGRAAGMALAQGAYLQAADLYFLARRRSPQMDQKAQLLQAGVDALLAANEPLLAYQAAERESKPLLPGSPYYWKLISLALGAAQSSQAAANLQQVIAPAWDSRTLAVELTAAQLQIAFDTYSAVANLAQALRIAQAGRVQQPDNPAWLERYAQLSEWSGQPENALNTWLDLVRRSGSAQALDNVFRLAPGLYNDAALLVAWAAVQRSRRLDDAEVRSVVAVYERMGDIGGAMAFLERQIALHPGSRLSGSHPYGLQALKAVLLERAGLPRDAAAVLAALVPGGLERADALRLGRLNLKFGNQTQALQALLAWKGEALIGQDFDADYWSLLADLAFAAGDRTTARRALQALVAHGTPAPYLAEQAVRLELDEGNPAAARSLAVRLYRPDAGDRVVFAWLDAIGVQPSIASLQALLDALAPSHLVKLEKDALFLESRGGLYARLGLPAKAGQDYRAALAIKPEVASLRIAYWWLLLDQRETGLITAEVAQQFARVRRDGAYLEVLAAALQTLDRPQLALALLQPTAAAHANDFLWLMNYADVLERSQRGAAAFRVRRHAWVQVNRLASAPDTKPELARQALMTQLRLADRFAGGTQKMRWQQQLGRLLAAGSADAGGKRQLDDLAAAWLLSEGRFDAATRWLWSRQAARMQTPAYQLVALALADGDLEKLDLLLEKSARAVAGSDDRLGSLDESVALRELKRTGQAITLRVESGQRLPEGLDDETQIALQDDLLRSSSSVNGLAVERNFGALSRSGLSIQAAWAVLPRLKITANLSALQNRTTNMGELAAVPGKDREARLGVKALTSVGDINAQWLTYQSLARVSGAVVSLRTRYGSHVDGVFQAGRNDRTEDSAPLAVAGMRDYGAAGLVYRIGDAGDVGAGLAASRFKTQTGAFLGRTTDALLTGNWYLTRAYPDIRLQAGYRRSRIEATGQPDAAVDFLVPDGQARSASYFLGQSSTAYSLALGVGMLQSDPSVLRNAWRSYGEAGFESRRNAVSRSTQGLLRLGIAGPVAGRDRLVLQLELRPSPRGELSSAAARELRLQYQSNF